MAPRRVLPVSVLIVNYNGLWVLKDCLESLKRADPAPAEILVVDNGSTDGSIKKLRPKFRGVRWLALEKNLGFAAGNNRGLEKLEAYTRWKAVLLCNNDTVVEPTMLGGLWEALQRHPRWATVGPRILYHDSGRIWFEGASLNPWLGRPVHWKHGRPVDPPGEAFELPANGFVTGCAMLIRREALKQLGGLDESLWSYGEDFDWCLRARAAGWECGVEPGVSMDHLVSSTFGQMKALTAYYVTRNTLRMIRRHRQGPWGFWPLPAAVFIGLICIWRVLRALGRGGMDVAGAILRGVRDFVKGAV